MTGSGVWASITLLEPEQEDLLATLVEHALSAPIREQRWFVTYATLGGPESILEGTGGSFAAPRNDVDALIRAGVLAVSSFEQYGQVKFYVSPEGFQHYEELKRSAGEPVQTIEADVLRYIDGDAFASAFPAAYKLWSEAADLLWGADSAQQLTTIGHKAREAMQECANALVERHGPPDVETDPAKTINRAADVVATVIASKSSQLGEARTELLKGLVGYWRGVNAVVQRQEHSGPAKQGDEVTWADGRRVVLHCAVVMSELARELM